MISRNLRMFIMAAAITTFLILPGISLADSPGLAVGQKGDYAHAWPTVIYESDATVAVGVLDQRPYVRSGKKAPNYCGVMRAAIGKEWDMETRSGQPLPDDVAGAIVDGLMSNAIQAKVVPISSKDSQEQAMAKLLNSGCDRLILLDMKEWQSDSYYRLGFFIDATMYVYDAQGNLLASGTASHKTQGEGDGTVKAPETAAAGYLSRLLNNEKIKVALNGK
ncbi:MAG: hypothetical protein KQJ78_02965 [Deltaproteobacteria bacterium]|nr:hypothetical protein [Deltaproteobacteria bacterium]